MKEVQIKVKYDTAEAEKSSDELKGSIKETKNEATGLTNSLDKVSGGAVSGFKAMLTGVKNVASGMNTLSGAIKASALGFLIISLASLAAAFKTSEEGQNKFSKMMSVIGAITGNLVDLMADFGEKIIWVFENPKQAISEFSDFIKQNIENRITGLLNLVPRLGEAFVALFSGEFKKAGQIAVDAVAQVGLGVTDFTDKVQQATAAVGEFIKENIREAGEAAKVAEMRAKANKIDRELLVRRAQLEAEIAEARLKSRQEDEFSASERIEFLNQAKALEDGLLDAEKESLRLKYEAQKLENTFSRTNLENMDKEAQALAALSQIESKRLTEQRSLLREFNRLNNEIEREKQEADKARIELLKQEDAELEKLRLARLNEQELEIEKVKQKYEELFSLAQKHGQDMAALEGMQKTELEAIEVKYTKSVIDEQNAILAARLRLGQLSGQVLADLSSIFSQSEKSSKAFAIASIIANQAVSLSQALAVSTAPTADNVLSAGVAGFIKFATISATITSTVAQIKNTLKGTPAIPVVSPVAGLGAGGNAGSQGFAPQVLRPDQIAQQFNQDALRAYVLVGDVNNGQEAELKLNNLSTL